MLDGATSRFLHRGKNSASSSCLGNFFPAVIFVVPFSIEKVIYGVIPQSHPPWIFLLLYRFESNIHPAIVVWMVGTGGIRDIFSEMIHRISYVSTEVIMLVVTVFSMSSLATRKRFV